jgi:SPP1 family predicted phage head-tail adaptor
MRIAGRNSAIDTGKLRDFITYQTYTRASDGEGGGAKTWTDSFGVYAKIIPTRNTRILEAAEIKFSAAFIVRIRYDVRIVGKNRFIYNGQAFVIHGEPQDIDSRHKYMEMMCYIET